MSDTFTTDLPGADRIDQLVQRGAPWLDEHMPGWADHINLDTMDLKYDHTCVLGQLANYLHEGADFINVVRFEDGCEYPALRPLGMTWPESCDLGFDLDESYEDPDAWAMLNDSWRAAIMARRS